MATKTTNEDIRSSSSSNYTSFKDMILDLKPDSRTGQTTVKIRLIGEAIAFMEYQKKYKDFDDLDEKGRPKLVEAEFPDGAKRKSFTRIGNDDIEQCYWAQNNWIGSKRYAQNCIVYNEDGTFDVKILNKGKTVFKPFAEKEYGNYLEMEEEGTEGLCTFFGGRDAPNIRITAIKDDKAPGKVRYEINVMSKLREITDEEIEALRAIHEPTPEQLKEYKAEYNARRADNPCLPSFEAFFEFGYDLRRIFAYTPPQLDDDDKPKTSRSAVIDEDDEEETPKLKKAKPPVDDEEDAPKVKKTAKAAVIEDDEEETPKTKKTKPPVDDDEEDAPKAKSSKNMFESADEDEDEWNL